ncbi:hypothetical protein N431DRAFT_461046 [Stipitochalara longipes BDJ]|nr:hypothetical protein N431DRAFT_461046 [Stipitochalara longipes BDJ]
MGGSDPEPVQAIEEKGKESFWYDKNIDREITPEFREFIKTYSGIPDEKILEHVYEVREKAWVIRAYPCTGQGQFLNPLIVRSPAYGEIVERLKKGERLLEIGCFIGHDLRRLVHDGAPSANLYAADIVSHWDVGYTMFNDRSRFHATFIETDILSPSPSFNALSSSVDIIWASKVLHQWDWATQLVALRSLIALSKPGTMVVGFHAGYVKADFLEDYKVWLHDEESWRKIWEEVGRETGTRWNAGQVSLRGFDELGISLDSVAYLGDKCRMLEFVVRRID